MQHAVSLGVPSRRDCQRERYSDEQQHADLDWLAINELTGNIPGEQSKDDEDKREPTGAVKKPFRAGAHTPTTTSRRIPLVSDCTARNTCLGPEIQFGDILVVQQVIGIALEPDAPLVEDIATVGEFEALRRVLFDH